MKIYNSIEEFNKTHNNQIKIAGTIGFFDGVHLGHRALIAEVIKGAQEIGGESLIVTFDCHPSKVLRPNDKSPLVLSSLMSKRRLLESTGIDHLIILHFTPKLAGTEAHKFIEPLVKHGGLKLMIMGYDNRFGRRHDMSLDDYDDYVTSWGVDYRRISPLWIDGEIVSSSAIRSRIHQCDFVGAEQMLGRPYSFYGTVDEGQRVGRTIDYPTANIKPLDPDMFLPAIGIYVSEMRVGNKVYPSMAYYGDRPTEGLVHRLSLEAHIFDFCGDLYGQEIEIGFKYFMRHDIKFANIELLAQQLKKDEEEARQYFKTHPLTLNIPQAVQKGNHKD